MRRATAYRSLVSALVLYEVSSSCARQNPPPPRNAVTTATLVAGPPLPQFTGVVGQFNAGTNFIQFLETNVDREVKLNITVPDAEFDGSTEDDNSFFIIFDDCGSQPADEKPVAGACTGTEIKVTNPDGPSLLNHRGVAWQLNGPFEVGEETGPLQGLMSIELTRKLRP